MNEDLRMALTAITSRLTDEWGDTVPPRAAADAVTDFIVAALLLGVPVDALADAFEQEFAELGMGSFSLN